MKQKVIGIYGIEDVETGDIYIGHSKDIAKRWSNHAAFLKNNEYRYKELQSAYNLDCKRIKYTILEECKISELKELEDWWIKYADNIDGWNVINKQKHGGESKTVSDTSNMQIAQTGENNGHCTKLNANKVRQIKVYQKNNTYNDEELSIMYNVSLTHINNIRNGKRWASIHIEDNKNKVESIGVDTTSYSTVFGDTVNL
ncbi:GIY-YIG nuclease family protein [Clostridium sp. JS66]|uniref:GIY-YIG nuclease family protein n=1 Tax=Clostridium sp. JS66 TaxID=3064705 RepID=UPI00298EC5FA|nr:GIY-YIG nuclease family protein [Clostridium sp. JS66]WPC42936.1 GIY-YIG nuclease family protein [Clostridium sp. JS66]